MGPVPRRQFLVAFGAVLAAPHAAGQPAARVFRVAFLSVGTPMQPNPQLDAFREALRGFGWIEGRNIVIEVSYAEGVPGRLQGLAHALVDQKVDVILPTTTPATVAARKATSTIPIVMAGTLDVQEAGLIQDLARPAANITGVTMISVQLAAKRLQLLKEVVPAAKRLGFLRPRTAGNPSDPVTAMLDRLTSTMEAAAQQLGMEFRSAAAIGPEEIQGAFARLEAARIDTLYVVEGSSFVHRALIADLALKARLPTMFTLPGYVEAGGLLCYGGDPREVYRRAASFVDRILKGAEPGDLPVEQPTRFELVINMKTAKALGLKIPQAILLRADQVIE
ncbi:MAG: ABC transporter substrate-binding protein [Betaproteobacteria bacterium]|jgi:putative ABC transport system substrate-binding protein|nr:ABC transporter substrate-binding protein [Betaproteobacteria bacterium]